MNRYHLSPVGVIVKENVITHIEIYKAYTDALLGLAGYSHIHVLYWLHENDTPENRQILQVHPRKDPAIPLTGVFATHSPVRPNPIALTRCRILSIEDNCIRIDKIDARDGSPVLDIKCYIPYSENERGIRVPDWV